MGICPVSGYNEYEAGRLIPDFFLYDKGVLSEKQHDILKNNQDDNYLEEAVECTVRRVKS